MKFPFSNISTSKKKSYADSIILMRSFHNESFVRGLIHTLRYRALFAPSIKGVLFLLQFPLSVQGSCNVSVRSLIQLWVVKLSFDFTYCREFPFDKIFRFPPKILSFKIDSPYMCKEISNLVFSFNTLFVSLLFRFSS